MKPQHISFEQLADLAEGRLPPEQRVPLQAHLTVCTGCSAQMESLARLVGLMRTDKSVDAPRSAVAAAVNLFRSRAVAEKPALVQRLLAALSFDSLSSAPAFGVRSGAPAAARQLLYSAGDNDLDLRVSQSGEQWTVSGQVLGPCAGGRAELEGDGGRAAAELNEQCEFTLSPLPTGSYTLRLRLSDVEIEIPEINLG